jgi:hypothetical protein
VIYGTEDRPVVVEKSLGRGKIILWRTLFGQAMKRSEMNVIPATGLLAGPHPQAY